MSDFLKLTLLSGAKTVLNVTAIERLSANRVGTLIVLKGGTSAQESNRLDVKEDFDDLASALGALSIMGDDPF
ncbi:hypothetical protein JIP62_06120 [Brevundimonas vitis]|uniref:Uncharacterized protein n=1 Tax=Brevundimonas vitisensis TaxID=2800818 RepID=A0ABX7BPY2_9CAUL|nr:hypothetical protein [Brevundimonas vitisensis]QQQ19659.1 hypothetical protein JIP62_06120 [Brevundimonas vitisensis]